MLNRDRQIRCKHRGGPLVRFLQANIGRPWDRVYSELCRQLKRNSNNERQVRDQIDRLVHRDVQEVGRQVAEAGSRSCDRIGQLLRDGTLYVCPRTGLLRQVRTRVPATKPRPTAEPPVIKVDDAYQCHWRDGRWYLLTMVALSSDPGRLTGARQDVWLNTAVTSAVAPELRKTYGGLRYAVHVRALSKHELRNWPIPSEWQ